MWVYSTLPDAHVRMVATVEKLEEWAPSTIWRKNSKKWRYPNLNTMGMWQAVLKFAHYISQTSRRFLSHFLFKN